MAKEKQTEIVGWPPRVWGEAVGVCPASVYNFLGRGLIEAKKVGGATRITTPPDVFLARQPDYKPGARPSPNTTGRNGRRSRSRDNDRQPEPPAAA